LIVSGCAGRPKGQSLGLLEAGEAANNDALRVTLGTVPGTVPKVNLEGIWKWNLRVILRPIWTPSPTVNWRAHLRGSDRLTAKVTPAVRCGAKRKATSMAVCRVTRRRTWTGTCDVNLKASRGSPSPTPVGCLDATRNGAWLLTARAPSGPLRRGRRSRQPQ
jgi:hypothetical protein